MDVLSLPDEMLASILKYPAFKDLTKIRKKSSKVDFVATRYNLNRVKINNLRLTMVDEDITVLLFCKDTNTSYFQRHPSQTVKKVLKCYLPKIRDLKCLRLYNAGIEVGDESCLSTEVADLILGKSCQKLTWLNIENFDLTMSFAQMRNILTKLKLKELSIHSSFSKFELSDELVDGLKCDSLALVNTVNASQISLSCLDKICARKLPNYLVCDIYNTTAYQLGQFFERHLPDPVASTVDWTLNVDKGAMAVDELRPYFSGLKCFKSLNVETFNTEKFIELTVFAEGDSFNAKVCIRVHL